MRGCAVHELASEIRRNLDALTSEFELRLREIGDYAEMPDEARFEAARNVLQLVATGLEAGDQDLLAQSVQSVAVEWMAQGFEIESMQQALDFLVKSLEPRLPDVGTANFLWRIVVQAHTALSQVAIARLRAVQESSGEGALLEAFPGITGRKEAQEEDQRLERDVTQRKHLEQQIRESLERRGRQVQTSTEIAQEIAGVPALSELYQRVVTLVKERFGYYHAQLFLLDEDGDRLVTVAGYGEIGRRLLEKRHSILLGRGVVGRAGARGQPILSPDVSQDPEWLYLPLLPDTRGELAVPIRLRDQVLGVLDVQSDQVGALSDDDRILMEGLCGQIAVAIESTRLREETEEHLRELERLTRAMSREGWEDVRREVGSVGYLFDRSDVVSAADLWTPEIGLASERQAFVPPGSNGHEVAVAPLTVRGGEFIGVLGVQDDPQAPLSQEELALIESVSEQVAQALESARLFEETQARLQRLAVLSDVSQSLAGAPLEAREIANFVVRQFVEVLGVRGASISLLEPDTGLLLVAADTQAEAEGRPRRAATKTYRFTDYPAVLRALQTLQPLVVHASDQNADPMELAYMRKCGHASLFILPLAVKGEAIGIVELVSGDGELPLTPEELDLATTLANQAAAVLENARLFDATRRQVKDLTMLSEVSQTLASAPLRALEIAQIIVKQLRVVMDISEASISLLAPDGDTMEVVADIYSEEGSPQPAHLEERFSLAEYPATARVMETLLPLIVHASDPGADPAERAYMREFKTETLAIFPLAVKGEAFGVLELEMRGRERQFSPPELSTIRTLTNQIAVALENARLFEQTQAALAEVEATHRSYLRQAWQEYLRRQEMLERGAFLYEQSLGEAAPMVGDAVAARDFWRPEIEKAVAKGAPVTVEGADGEGGRTSLAVPIVLRGHTLGVLGVEAPLGHRQWTEEEVTLIEAVSEQLAQTLETTRLFEETSRRAEQMSTLNQVGLDLTSGLELELVLQMLYEHCTEVFVTDSFYVALYDEGTGMLEFPLVTGIDGPVKRAPRLASVIHGEPGQLSPLSPEDFVIQTGETLHIPDTLAIPKDAPYHAFPISDQPNRCYVGVPLASRGQVIGVLSIQSRTPHAYTREDLELLTTLATQASITIENARAYERLVETAEQLREIDRFKTQFLANMSHELRTPLNSIIGFSRVMLKGIDGPVTDLQEADLTSIYSSGQHLLSLINSILDMSKIEAGKMDLAFEEVSIPEVLDACVSVAKALVKDRPIELRAMVADDLPTVWADAQRVRQVILNLLSNAVKFTEKGHIILRAEADAEADGQRRYVIISVSDTGIGIDPEAQELLFVPFQQVDGSTTRRAEGTGLGLAISRSFIDLHGGEIWVESVPGKGSTFAFTLPIYKAALQRQEEIETDPDPSKKIVLAIDDDAGVITLLKRYLENDGYQVIGVTESLRAVETAQRLASNLTAITLDVAMPDLDGWQILQALKRDPVTHGIPIVLLSILDDVARGTELGAGVCLRKPVTRNDVLDALRKVEDGCR